MLNLSMEKVWWNLQTSMGAIYLTTYVVLLYREKGSSIEDPKIK